MTRLMPMGLMAALLLAACGSTSQQGPCSARTCQGCCSAEGKCEAGNTAGACGAIGGTCRDCAGLGLTCTLGSCSPLNTGSGGGSGGTGGGATGGGSGGGSGGGATGGGAGGGATGGGSGGGGASMGCSLNNGGCAAEATCTPQGASRICTCSTGYVGDGFTCSDVNECSSANGGCSANATCANLPGTRTCTCSTGYSGDGVTCNDLDECLSNNGGCSANANCTNVPGSRSCACRSGFTGDGFTCTASVPTWTIETVAVLGGATSSLALDAAGVPAIAYASDSPRGVHFRQRLTGSWSSAETVDSATNALEPALALSNTTWLIANSVFNAGSSSVACWRRSPLAAWFALGGLSGPERPDLAAGGGREYLVSHTRITGQPNSTVYFVSRTAGTSPWSSTTTVSSTASGFGAQLAASPSGQLAVLYGRNSDSSLWLARSSGLGTSWTHTQITTSRAWDFDLVFDLSDSGLVHLAYYTPDSHLIRAESWSGSTRLSQVTVDSPGGTGLGSQWFSGVSIAADGLGDVHLSYLDFTRGNVLRYATNSSGSFVSETVTQADDVLGNTSIAVDNAFAPHVSFPRPATSFGNLGYAVKR